jgi:hypothetical protein
MVNEQIVKIILMETKKIYRAPHFEIIYLDNEISLALQSAPPAGPDEGALFAPEYRNNDPFMNNLG